MKINWASLGDNGSPSEIPTTVRLYYQEYPNIGSILYVPVNVYTSHILLTDLKPQNVQYRYYIAKNYPTYGEVITDDYEFRTPRTYG
jgi:hypothetical protein